MAFAFLARPKHAAGSSSTPIRRRKAVSGQRGVDSRFERPTSLLHGTSLPIAPVIQAKLKIGEPNDKYEQEADRVADMVMQMPEPASINRMSLESVSIGQCIQRLCPECEEKLHRKPIETSDRIPKVPSDVQMQMNGLGNGQPLPRLVRAFFEPRFGTDSSFVRAHTNSNAAQSGKTLNARAFTVGGDIFFGSGQFAPRTPTGGNCPPTIIEEPEHPGECDEITREEGELHDFERFPPAIEKKSSNCWLIMNLPSEGTDVGQLEEELATITDQVIYGPPGATVTITGYTDCVTQVGSQRNRQLRLNRAYAVERFFIDLGVSSERILIEAAPLTEYMASNSTPRGRARNRGVAISVNRHLPTLVLSLDDVVNRARDLLNQRPRAYVTNNLFCVLDLITTPNVDDRWIAWSFLGLGSCVERFTARQFAHLIRHLKEDLTDEGSFGRDRTDRQFLDELLRLEFQIRETIRLIAFVMGTRGGFVSPCRVQVNDWIAERQRDSNSIYSCFR